MWSLMQMRLTFPLLTELLKLPFKAGVPRSQPQVCKWLCRALVPSPVCTLKFLGDFWYSRYPGLLPDQLLQDGVWILVFLQSSLSDYNGHEELRTTAGQQTTSTTPSSASSDFYKRAYLGHQKTKGLSRYPTDQLLK